MIRVVLNMSDDAVSLEKQQFSNVLYHIGYEADTVQPRGCVIMANR